MRIFKFKDSRIKNIIGRSFIFSSVFTLVIALVGSIYFNSIGLQMLRQNNLQREQQLLSNFLVPAIAISDMMEVRRLLSLASDINEKFAIIDNSSNILIPNYDDFNLVKLAYINKGTLPNCDAVKTGYQVIEGNKLWINCSTLTMNNVNKNHSVGILISFSPYPSLWFTSLAFYFFGIAVVSLLLNAIWFRRILHKRLLNPLTILGGRIIELVRSPFSSVSYLDDIKDLPYEVNEIKNAFQSVLTHLQTEYQQRTESEKKAALIDQAARVAHDIRSPIAAMEVSLYGLSQDVSNEKILMLQLAVQSVRDIANNLLEQYRDNYSQKNANSERSLLRDDLNITRPILLYSLIEEIASQKRYEWLNKSCELKLSFMPHARSTWVNVIPVEIKRMISNLLNNAIEACRNNAKITIQLNKFDEKLELCITDNGAGISPIKIKDFLSGESSKHGGKGLGLSGAKKYMESIRGELAIVSELENGTTVTLAFDVPSHPIWYPDKIYLSMNDVIIVLDDDVAMQTLWVQRLQNYPVKIHLFSNYIEADNWIKHNKDLLDKIILLVDYELAGQPTNGLILLENFGLKDHSYLVTSHAEEVDIQSEAEKLGIWLIPKTLANDIPIELR